MDKNFFYSLYFGDYKPAEEYPITPELQLAEDKVSKLRDSLVERLDENTLEIFEELKHAQLDLNSLYESRAYSQGIKFILDILINVSAIDSKIVTNEDDSEE